MKRMKKLTRERDSSCSVTHSKVVRYAHCKLVRGDTLQIGQSVQAVQCKLDVRVWCAWAGWEKHAQHTVQRRGSLW